MSAWGNSFGTCEGGPGGDVEVLVDAIRTADINTILSAGVIEQAISADIVTTCAASVQSTTLTADCLSILEATP